MKLVAIVLFGCVLILAGCGGAGATSSQPASGFWSVTLTNPASPESGQVLSFTFTLTQNGNSLAGSSLNLNEPTSCFGPTTSISGQLTPGMAQAMPMQIVMISANSGAGQNQLVMTGTMTPAANGATNGASGSFTLTGATPGCVSTSGTFTMTRQLTPH